MNKQKKQTNKKKTKQNPLLMILISQAKLERKLHVYVCTKNRIQTIYSTGYYI